MDNDGDEKSMIHVFTNFYLSLSTSCAKNHCYIGVLWSSF